MIYTECSATTEWPLAHGLFDKSISDLASTANEHVDLEFEG